MTQFILFCTLCAIICLMIVALFICLAGSTATRFSIPYYYLFERSVYKHYLQAIEDTYLPVTNSKDSVIYKGFCYEIAKLDNNAYMVFTRYPSYIAISAGDKYFIKQLLAKAKADEKQ